jgi:hypothetical protein
MASSPFSVRRNYRAAWRKTSTRNAIAGTRIRAAPLSRDVVVTVRVFKVM